MIQYTIMYTKLVTRCGLCQMVGRDAGSWSVTIHSVITEALT